MRTTTVLALTAALALLQAAGPALGSRDDPEVRLIEPERGERRFVAPATIQIEAKAKAARGRSIARVEFFADGRSIGRTSTTPHEITWSNVAPGHYSLRAKATDNRGASDWSPAINVRVHANHEPRVRLIEPDRGDRFSAPAAIELQAVARDRDHNLVRVEFYANQQLIGQASRRPWRFTWTGVQPGDYVLEAKAIDALGAFDMSRPVPIKVTGTPIPTGPRPYYIHVDHLNTPRLVANATGTTVWRWDQAEPFGVSVPDENPSGLGAFEFPMRFPGQYADKETNLHYSYFRDCYDAATGRYCQSDPIGLRGGLNTYAYARSNTLSYTDPYGLFVGKWHLILTGEGITDAGMAPWVAEEVAKQSVLADWIPSGTQDPANAHWHAMRDPSQQQAQERYERFLEEQIQRCSLQGLGRAIHAAQDSAARGHRGNQPWPGGMPTWQHFKGDIHPTDAELALARQRTGQIIERYQRACGCAY